MSHRPELPGSLPVDAARRIVLEGLEPLPAEAVALDDSVGRVTAAAAITAGDVPAFDTSAMDGYALRAADCPGPEPAGREFGQPVELNIVGESSAGAPWPGMVESGSAISISTGAEMPAGADSVVKVEDTGRRGGSLLVVSPVTVGQNVRGRGQIMAAGAEVLAPGNRIGPVELGLLASTGTDPVPCHARPRVSIVVTGDELVPPSGERGPGQIWDSNLPVISAMASAAGAEVVSATTAADTMADTKTALGEALECDLAVVCGGVSVGGHDYVKAALAELGAERRFWGLAMKPGRPTWFGDRGGTRVLGLPGNPVSALAVFAILGLPLLRGLSGLHPADVLSAGRLIAPVDRLGDRLLAAPCRVADRPGGIELEPIPIKGSHDFVSLSGASALALIEAGTGRVAAGEVVGMVPLLGE